MTLAVAVVAWVSAVVISREHYNLIPLMLGGMGVVCYVLGRYTRRRVRAKEW